MNAESLRDLGFRLEERAPGGESGGAWFAVAPDGERVLLKWFAGGEMAERYAALLPALDVLRSRGVPVPQYRLMRVVEAWTLSAQQILPGRSIATWPSQLIGRMIACVSAAEGVNGPPLPSGQEWGESVVRDLTVGGEGEARHDSLHAHSDRARRIIERIREIGAGAERSWFPTSGLVHYDLHTDNVLAFEDGALSGIIDWENACAGDHRYDLVSFAFDLDGHGQQAWDRIEALVEPRVLRAYAAHMTLRRTDWAIRYRPDDVPRQLERAERVIGL